MENYPLRLDELDAIFSLSRHNDQRYKMTAILTFTAATHSLAQGLTSVQALLRLKRVSIRFVVEEEIQDVNKAGDCSFPTSF